MVDLAHIQALFSFPVCRLLLAHVPLDKLTSSTCEHVRTLMPTHGSTLPALSCTCTLANVFPCLYLFPFSILNTRAHTHKRRVPALDKCSKANFCATESPFLPKAHAVQRLGLLVIGWSEASLVGDWPETAPGAQRR